MATLKGTLTTGKIATWVVQPARFSPDVATDAQFVLLRPVRGNTAWVSDASCNSLDEARTLIHGKFPNAPMPALVEVAAGRMWKMTYYWREPKYK